MSEKICERCGETKPASEFRRFQNSSGGPWYRSRTCRRCALDADTRPRVALVNRDATAAERMLADECMLEQFEPDDRTWALMCSVVTRAAARARKETKNGHAGKRATDDTGGLFNGREPCAVYGPARTLLRG